MNVEQIDSKKADSTGPDELWVVQFRYYASNYSNEKAARAVAKRHGGTAIRYIRADLAGEVK